jgi:hypothetical protein
MLLRFELYLPYGTFKEDKASRVSDVHAFFVRRMVFFCKDASFSSFLVVHVPCSFVKSVVSCGGIRRHA